MPPTELLIHSAVTGHYPGRVPPFGYSRLNAYLQLPVTFRSLSRPSSAISALASTLRSYSLDLCQPPFTLLRLLGELQFFSVSFRILLTSSFLPYLCSFQGALKVSLDPSKRYSALEELHQNSFSFGPSQTQDSLSASRLLPIP